jgi:hypothetical protein
MAQAKKQYYRKKMKERRRKFVKAREREGKKKERRKFNEACFFSFAKYYSLPCQTQFSIPDLN